jgi:hypothetical protein
MIAKESCTHACFEELGENKWCIECGAVEVSPARHHRYISWKHTVTGSQWVVPGSQAVKNSVDEDPVASGYSLESNSLRRHQQAIVSLNLRVDALERRQRRKEEVLTMTLNDLADVIMQLRTQRPNLSK